MSFLGKLWYGLYSLPKAFWGFYFLGFFVAYFSLAMFLVLFRPNITVPAYILLLLILYTYVAIASVGVWRSAATKRRSAIWLERMWAIIARGVVVIAALSVVVKYCRAFGYWPY